MADLTLTVQSRTGGISRWPPLVAANQAAPFLLALAGWISLLPYILWNQPRALMFGALIAALVAGVVWLAEPRTWDGIESVGVVLLSAFLVLITWQTKLDGGHIKWVFALPTVVVLWLLSVEQRRECLNAFVNIFALSLAPGLLVILYVAVGGSVEFGSVMGMDGTPRLSLPGMVLIEANRLDLPWGGVLYRFCGMYDEPGMVGTIGALLLAAMRFRINDWRAVIIWTAGILSFSLAFSVLVTIGLLVGAGLTRKRRLLLAVLPIMAIIVLAVRPWLATSTNCPENVRPSECERLLNSVSQGTHSSLRQHTLLDRSTGAMNQLVDEYLHTDIHTLLFGIASDASVVRGAQAQIWTRILTDHGIVGLVLLGCGAGLIGLSALRRAQWSPWAGLFLVLYAMSAYQRPVIWLPYTLLLLFCACPFQSEYGGASPRRRN